MKHKYVKTLLAMTTTMMVAGSIPAMTFAEAESTAAESTEETEDTEATEESGEKGKNAPDTAMEQMENATLGKITAIEGSTVTVALGTMEMGQKPDGEAPSGEAPSGEASEMQEGEAPEKPEGEDTNENTDETETDGEASDENAPSGEAPEMPDGEAPEMPDGEAPQGMGGGFTESGETMTLEITEDTKIVKREMESETEITVDDLSADDILMIEMDGDTVKTLTVMNMGGPGQGGAGMGGAGGDMAGSSEGSTALTAAYTADGEELTSDGETYDSTEADVSAVLVQNGGSLTMTNGTLTKTGDTSDVDQSNFYALNAGVAVKAGSTATISDTTIETDAEGANAVFASGEGAAVTADNITIHTTKNSSRGLDATYGGTVTATNVDITTEGAHCAPLATDRGEGTITVTGGTLSASGEGSPCIYSTGNITATDVTGNAAGSQTLVVEGKNSVTLNNCDLTGAGENGLMLYQSTSGDAGEGTAVLTSTGSTLTTTSDGPMFYITNTDAEAHLTNTELEFSSGILVKASGNNTNNWGTEGENGGDFRLTGSSQNFTGDITCDEISTVEVDLTESSLLEGTVDGENTGKSVTISLDDTSTWKVTGDSHVTVLKNETEDNSNIVSNGFTIYYDAENEENAWLGGETITLADGGSITPEE